MSKHAAVHDRKVIILDGSSSDLDVNFLTGPCSSVARSSSCWNKRSRSWVVPRDVIEIDEDDDQDVVIIGETLQDVVIIGETLSDNKKKKPMEYGNASINQLKGHLSDNKKKKPMEYGNVSINQAKPHGVEANMHRLLGDMPEMPTMKPKLVIEDEVSVKYKAFKQFDTVRDYSDHHFSKLTPAGNKPGKDWVKRIQHEWKVLEKDLPEEIYVRIYEDKMDILRAVIIGPSGTPYHDGLFFFDICFPPSYPLVPPMVHYHSGGLRLNPNLYDCGKVCLSLLNTWSGQGCEKWNSSNSTMLQVLVSIQALVLNAKPYFNEPGFANSVNTHYGDNASLAYNETTFILSCKTMLYSLRNPPKHFEDFVLGYFRHKGRAILTGCRAYIQGAQIGCVTGDGAHVVTEGDKSSSWPFQKSLGAIFEQMMTEFTSKGVDTDKLSAPVMKGLPK